MAKASKIDPLALESQVRAQFAADIRHWFQEERGERLGDLASELLVDFVQEKVARHWYDKGVQDARALVRDRMERLDDDLDLLRR